MDSSRRSSVTPAKSRLARTFAKVLHAHTAAGITPVDGLERVKSSQKVKEAKINQNIKVNRNSSDENKSFDPKADEELRNRVSLEALLARIFASIACIKAAYSQLQLAQSPYNADVIQTSDSEVVSELKIISELKQCYLKNQFDIYSEKVLISAEIQEQKSILRTYEIMKKKLESQLRLKESEIIFLGEKLEECRKENRSIERRLNASGQLSSIPDNLHLSGLSPTHFIPVLKHTVRSIRSFVKLMVSEMQSSGWDVDTAASTIHPGVMFWKQDHKCFAFESFVCREMFDNFHNPNFSLPNESLPDPKHQRRLFFERFLEFKTIKAKDYLIQKPKSTFGKFCRAKYLRLVHPKLESSFFGDLNQRNMVNAGESPGTNFFTTYAEMAKRVWLLHCLAFSFNPQVMIFQVRKGCRFSEVFMESVSPDDDPFMETSSSTDPSVAFTVVPGFKIGKTVLQSQVYLSRT